MADRFAQFLQEWREQLSHVKLDDDDARKLYEIVERVLSEEFSKKIGEVGYSEDVPWRKIG